ncbi:MAG: hypothetical protein NVSMB17_15170 [Candidatus Dormibacteria bacterium]
MTHGKKLLLALGLGISAFSVAAVSALGCIPIATLSLSQGSAAPGTQLTATMQQANSKAGPVTLHWNSVDGPVLASAVPAETGLSVTFTVPESPPGTYIVVATQDLKTDVATWGMPARAAFTVSGADGQSAAPPQASATRPEARPTGLVSAGGPGAGVLVLVALGVAAVGLMAVGAAVLVAGGRAQAVSRA